MDKKATKLKQRSCPLGAHFSISGGLDHAMYTAKRYGCDALQLFTKNATTWKERDLTRNDIDRFESAKKQTHITQIASHTSYLINLAAVEKNKHIMSVKALSRELIRSSELGIRYVVLHPGAHMGRGEKEGIKKIANSINEIFDKNPNISTRLLLETTAGQGSSVGCTFESLKAILEKLENPDRIGICLDTSHIFAAGYDIRTPESYRKTVQRFDSIIGLAHLYLIHLNDSKKELGSRVDRHEHIGLGMIGLDAFGYVMNDRRLGMIPKIIETPKGTGKDGKDWDNVNLEKLRKLVT